jgi:ElaB/YqjD/DUF883 family membrane-anchored ribosome-binding protein
MIEMAKDKVMEEIGKLNGMIYDLAKDESLPHHAHNDVVDLMVQLNSVLRSMSERTAEELASLRS